MSPRPNICQMVPTTFHGISSGSAISTRQKRHRQPSRGIESATMIPSGTSISEDDGGEQEVAPERVEEALAEFARRIQELLKPADPVPEELVIAEAVLH